MFWIFFQIAVEQLYFFLRIFPNVHGKNYEDTKRGNKKLHIKKDKKNSLKISWWRQVLPTGKQFLIH